MSCHQPLPVPKRRHQNGVLAFTLAEVMMATGIAATVIGGIIYGYLSAAFRAERSGYSLAAHAQAMQLLERIKGATWDTEAEPAVDHVTTNYFKGETNLLDVPLGSSTNRIYCTNRITITTISTTPQIKMIIVETTWPFPKYGFQGKTVVTNKVAGYRVPQT